MSDIVVPGFASSELMADLSKAFADFSAEERQKLIKQVIKKEQKSIFEKKNSHTYQCIYRSMAFSNSLSRIAKVRKKSSLLIVRRKVPLLVVRVPSRLMPSYP